MSSLRKSVRSLLPLFLILGYCSVSQGATGALTGTGAWHSAGTWDNGVPTSGTEAFLGHNQASAPVAGVTVNVVNSGDVANQVITRNNSILNINGGTLTVGGSGGWLRIGPSTVNINSGTLTSINFTGIGRDGVGQATLNVYGGILESLPGVAVSENGQEGDIFQSGGLVKIGGDLRLNTGGGCGACSSTWTLSGGQLVVTGTDANPLEWVRTEFGTAGGIVLSGTGEFYIRGDRTSDLTLLDASGDANLSGAVTASFGNWVLSDSTPITGYTKFTGAPVPEPSTFALAALGLVGLGWFGIRRRRK